MTKYPFDEREFPDFPHCVVGKLITGIRYLNQNLDFTISFTQDVVNLKISNKSCELNQELKISVLSIFNGVEGSPCELNLTRNNISLLKCSSFHDLGAFLLMLKKLFLYSITEDTLFVKFTDKFLFNLTKVLRSVSELSELIRNFKDFDGLTSKLQLTPSRLNSLTSLLQLNAEYLADYCRLFNFVTKSITYLPRNSNFSTPGN